MLLAVPNTRPATLDLKNLDAAKFVPLNCTAPSPVTFVCCKICEKFTLSKLPSRRTSQVVGAAPVPLTCSENTFRGFVDVSTVTPFPVDVKESVRVELVTPPPLLPLVTTLKLPAKSVDNGT